MQKPLHLSSLIPPGFLIVKASSTDGTTTITVRSTATTNKCLKYGKASARIHSHYRRRLADLPLAGRMVY